MKNLIVLIVLLMAGSAWANGDGYDWNKAAKETTEALRKDKIMDEFEKHYDDFPFGFPLNTKARHLYTWQEATKQRDAQYELMAEHTGLSIREDAIIGERGRIVEIIDSESYHAINAQAFIMRVKERIEKEE